MNKTIAESNRIIAVQLRLILRLLPLSASLYSLFEEFFYFGIISIIDIGNQLDFKKEIIGFLKK